VSADAIARAVSSPRTARARELVEALTAAGIRATADIRTAVPPCVLVEPLPRLNYAATMCGEPAAVWTIVALAPAPGTLTAADVLDTLLQAVSAVIDLDDATPGTYATGYSADPLPAYVMTHTEP
jgi:hypothetical protein